MRDSNPHSGVSSRTNLFQTVTSSAWSERISDARTCRPVTGSPAPCQRVSSFRGDEMATSRPISLTASASESPLTGSSFSSRRRPSRATADVGNSRAANTWRSARQIMSARVPLVDVRNSNWISGLTESSAPCVFVDLGHLSVALQRLTDAKYHMSLVMIDDAVMAFRIDTEHLTEFSPRLASS